MRVQNILQTGIGRLKNANLGYSHDWGYSHDQG